MPLLAYCQVILLHWMRDLLRWSEVSRKTGWRYMSICLGLGVYLKPVLAIKPEFQAVPWALFWLLSCPWLLFNAFAWDSLDLSALSLSSILFCYNGVLMVRRIRIYILWLSSSILICLSSWTEAFTLLFLLLNESGRLEGTGQGVVQWHSSKVYFNLFYLGE